MTIPKIELKNETLLIVGPIYDKIEKLNEIDKLYDKNKIIVFLGDICFPGTSAEITERIKILNEFMEKHNSYYIVGDKDLIFNKNPLSSNNLINENLLALKCNFDNNSMLLLLHGGVLNHTLEKINDIEIAFITDNPEINKPWHISYNGRLGYIISSHCYDSEVKHYNFSSSLDTKAYETNILAIQEFDKNGLGKTYYV